MSNDFRILGAMGLAWGYNPYAETPERTAKEEVAAFNEHAARGVRHYLLSRMMKWTLCPVLASPVLLAIAYYSTMGAVGILVGALLGLALIYGYARLAWRWFRM